MSTYKRLPRGKPKRVDEFITWSHKAILWINANWRQVVTGAASLAVIAALVIVGYNYLGNREEKASELFYKAARITDQTEAKAALEEVIKKYPKLPAGKLARLKEADILYNGGEYGKIKELLDPLTRDSNHLIKALALHNIAAALEASGDFDGAAASYLAAYEDKNNPARGVSYFEAARAFQLAGKQDDAKRILSEILESDEFDPAIKEESRDYLLWMGIKKD